VTRRLLAINVAVFLFVNVPLGRGFTAEDLQDPATVEAVNAYWEVTRDAVEEQGIRLSQQDWLQSLTHYDLFAFEWGYKPGAASWLDLLAAMFLHAGFMHLAGNMLFLWIFGDNVEDRLGHLGYLCAYLGTGVIATLSFAVMDSTSMLPLVGASGAISGVLGMYLLWFPRNRVKVFIWLWYFFADVVLIRAVWVLGFYLIVQNLFPALSGAPSSVAYVAHIGGFVAGMAVAAVMNLIQRDRPRPVYAEAAAPRMRRPGGSPVNFEPRPTAPDPDVANEFTRAVERSQYQLARQLFARITQQGGPLPASASVFEFGRWLVSSGRMDDARNVLRFYVSHYPRGPELAQAHFGLGLAAQATGQTPAARDHYLTVLDLAGQGSPLGLQAREALADLK
jgi:membrane associated rhomboid family serine protease